MIPPNAIRLAAAASLAAFVLGACERDTSGLAPAPPYSNPLVFDDDFADLTIFQPFLDTDIDAVNIDSDVKREGAASLKVDIPPPGSSTELFTGGAFTTFFARDLSSYAAITFWARANKVATLNIAGLGNDNTGTSLYEASWSNIALTPTWQKYAVPIPLAQKLSNEAGLFFFAEGHEGDQDYNIWFDEIRFEDAAAVKATVGEITNPRPRMFTRRINVVMGANVVPSGTQTVFSVGGVDQTVDHSPWYFSFTSSDESVASATEGSIQAVGGGSANLTAKLGTLDVTGTLTVNVLAPPPVPAPAPTLPAGDVISLFSNSYDNVTVDTWSATWDQADVADARIGNDEIKAYTNLAFAGIEFTSQTIDATAMTHFHIDCWVVGGIALRVKLVDFGADGTFGGVPDAEHELSFTESSDPPLVLGTWMSLDLPLAEFTNLVTRGHMAQIIIAGTPTIFIDNVYFHK